jgi:putative tryptophan/tyrosine transport system substrate-binding protein
MDRRAFLGTLAGGLLAAPLAAEAQPAGKVSRIGLLIPAPGPAPGVMPPIVVPAFLAGMRERGWLENLGFVLETRYAEGRLERLPELAGELVRLKVDVIVAMGTPATMAVKRATTTIPVVFGLVGDPVGSGVVPNLARPGGNVTGMSLYLPEVLGKALEILKEALPRAELVVITSDPDNRAQSLADAHADVVAKARSVRLHRVDVRHISEYEAAFKMAVSQRADAVLVSPQLPLPKQMADFAVSHRLPIMTLITAPGAQVGQLMIYGPRFADQVHRVAGYVDRILRGARPGDLPVEQADRFELTVNLKTAKALGLTIPPSVLQRADQVIE